MPNQKVTMAAHTSLGVGLISEFGTEKQKAELMPDLCSGRKLGAFGLTEPEAGSDAGATKTRATLEDGEWVINGAKRFNTGMHHATHDLVFARTSGKSGDALGITAFLGCAPEA